MVYVGEAGLGRSARGEGKRRWERKSYMQIVTLILPCCQGWCSFAVNNYRPWTFRRGATF